MFVCLLQLIDLAGTSCRRVDKEEGKEQTTNEAKAREQEEGRRQKAALQEACDVCGLQDISRTTACDAPEVTATKATARRK